MKYVIASLRLIAYTVIGLFSLGCWWLLWDTLGDMAGQLP